MTLKVHPGIGVARIGNSPTDWAIAPETIEIEAPPPGGYRDASCRIKRLGARFRVFEHIGGADPVEIVASATTTISWRVRLGSSAAIAGFPEGASNVETISGLEQVKVFASVPITVPFATSLSFGEIRTDSEGRLIVLSSRTLVPPLFQGQCDGWVQATVTRSGTPEEAVEASVLVTAPDFAPGRRPVVSFYDLLYQRHGLAAPVLPSFRKDIFPILRARSAGRPLAVEASFPLLSGAAERRTVAGIDPAIPPVGEMAGGITAVEFAILAKWIDGNPGLDFLDDWPAAGTLPAPIALTPAELDRGPLSHCLGSGVGTWESSGVPLAASLPALYSEPFRRLPGGAFGSLLPHATWQEDLSVCVGISSWAPQVETPGDSLAGGSWSSRGFMVLQNDDLEYVEVCAHPYVLLLTPTIDFGAVPRGPGGVAAFSHRPIVFEVSAPDDAGVELVLASPPSPFFAFRGVAVTVPAGQQQTVKLWVTYLTGAVAAPHQALLTVSGPDGASYEVLVRATTSEYEPTQLALVLDCSFSMEDDRGDGATKLQGLIAASKRIVDLGRNGDGLGVARFSSDVILPSWPVAPLNVDRAPIKTYLDGLVSVAGTSIGDGLAAGRDLLAADVTSTYAHEALIVITDGKENQPAFIENVAATLAARTFAIGIGTPGDVDASTLQVLTGNRGGYLLLTGDPVAAGNYFTLEKYLLQVLAGIAHEDLIIDPEGVVLPGAVERIVFPVTEADLAFDAVVFSTAAERLSFALRAPDGELVTASALSGSGRFIGREGVSYFRIPLPFVGGAGAPVPTGDWELLIALRPEGAHESETAALFREPVRQGKPVPYCAAVTTRSALNLRVDVGQKELTAGSPLWVEAVLTAFGAPWSAAQVRAELSGPLGLQLELPLTETESGRFTASYLPVRPGLYRLLVRAQGRSPRGQRFKREMTVTAAVLPSGTAHSEGSRAGCRCPEPPTEGRAPAEPGRCARVAQKLAAGLSRLARKLGELH